MATPFHSTERCFRRYEKIIAQIVQRFPQDVKFQCIKRSPSTDAARLLDAMNSFRINNWHSTLVDRVRFVEEVYKKVKVEPIGDQVVVSPMRPPQLEVVETLTTELYAGRLSQPTNEQIVLAINAIEKGVVTLAIYLDELTDQQVMLIESEVDDCFNVAIKKVSPTNIILI